MARLEERGRVEAGQVGGLFVRPPEDREGEEAGGEPRIEHVGVLLHIDGIPWEKLARFLERFLPTGIKRTRRQSHEEHINRTGKQAGR